MVKIESSTDGTHWSATTELQEGAWCRFADGEVLDSIYGCILQGLLHPADIASRCSLPVGIIEDILVDPTGSTGDYAAIAREYQAALKCAEYLSYAGIVMDMMDVVP